MRVLSTRAINVGWKRKLAAKCKDVLLTLRFYSQKPFFVTALPAGSARSGETTKRVQRTVGSPRAHGKASPNWSFHPEPLTLATHHLTLFPQTPSSNLNDFKKQPPNQVWRSLLINILKSYLSPCLPTTLSHALGNARKRGRRAHGDQATDTDSPYHAQPSCHCP